MKKILCMATALMLGLGAHAQSSLDDLLNRLKGQGGGESTEQSGDNGGSDILDALRGVGNALGVIPSKTVDVTYLEGEWAYQKPAVAFKSDNFLAKAGGVAASAKVESELEPYYKRVGLDNMKMTVKADSTFVMQLSRGKLSGTITTGGTKDAPALVFNFKALGKLPVGSMEAFVNAESSSVMSLTFDVTKLMTLIQRVATFTGNSSLKTLSSLLNNYDGLTAGFRMKKTSKGR